MPQRTQSQSQGRHGRRDQNKQGRSAASDRSSSHRETRQELSERTAKQQAIEPPSQSGSIGSDRGHPAEDTSVPNVPKREGRDPSQAERSDAARQGKKRVGEAMPRAIPEQAARPHWVRPGSEQNAEQEDDSAADESLVGAEAERSDDERRPLGKPLRNSGTLASFSDQGRAPVADPGLSVDPEDLGRQFLRDATEQGNFESEVNSSDSELGDVPFGQVISEATLDAAGQETLDLPESAALAEFDELADETARSADLELTSPVIREASLFDEPTELGGTRAPRIETDEMHVLDQHESAMAIDPEEREREKERERKALHHVKDRRDVQADTATWETNRQSPNERPRETANTPGMKHGARGKRE